MILKGRDWHYGHDPQQSCTRADHQRDGGQHAEGVGDHRSGGANRWQLCVHGAEQGGRLSEWRDGRRSGSVAGNWGSCYAAVSSTRATVS